MLPRHIFKGQGPSTGIDSSNRNTACGVGPRFSKPGGLRGFYDLRQHATWMPSAPVLCHVFLAHERYASCAMRSSSASESARAPLMACASFSVR